MSVTKQHSRFSPSLIKIKFLLKLSIQSYDCKFEKNELISKESCSAIFYITLLWYYLIK